MHLSNYFLADAPLQAVLVQVVYAAIIGVGFGALVLVANTVWIGIVIHGLVDAFGSLDEYFGSGAASDLPTSSSVWSYVSDISIISILTIPFAIWALKTAPLYESSSVNLKSDVL